jgi:hypothetical protein
MAEGVLQVALQHSIANLETLYCTECPASLFCITGQYFAIGRCRHCGKMKSEDVKAWAEKKYGNIRTQYIKDSEVSSAIIKCIRIRRTCQYETYQMSCASCMTHYKILDVYGLS